MEWMGNRKRMEWMDKHRGYGMDGKAKRKWNGWGNTKGM